LVHPGFEPGTAASLMEATHRIKLFFCVRSL
jgi:hypothetical protein